MCQWLSTIVKCSIRYPSNMNSIIAISKAVQEILLKH